MIEQATAIQISNQPSYDAACSLLLEKIKPFRSRWRDYWHGTDSTPGPIKLAHKAYKALLDKFNEVDGPLEAAETSVKNAIRVWDEEQERIQQELQRKAEQEAQERERREREQVANDPFGSDEDAKAVLEAPSTAVARPVAATYTRASGISKRENWKAKVKDMKALCRAVGAGKVPVEYVLPNESALNARAKADRLTMNVPGVIPYNDSVISGRSR